MDLRTPWKGSCQDLGLWMIRTSLDLTEHHNGLKSDPQEVESGFQGTIYESLAPPQELSVWINIFLDYPVITMTVLQHY